MRQKLPESLRLCLTTVGARHSLTYRSWQSTEEMAGYSCGADTHTPETCRLRGKLVAFGKNGHFGRKKLVAFDETSGTTSQNLVTFDETRVGSLTLSSVPSACTAPAPCAG
jgi:hypothetical protein